MCLLNLLRNQRQFVKTPISKCLQQNFSVSSPRTNPWLSYLVNSYSKHTILKMLKKHVEEGVKSPRKQIRPNHTRGHKESKIETSLSIFVLETEVN